ARVIRPFLKKFFLTTIETICHPPTRIDVVLLRMLPRCVGGRLQRKKTQECQESAYVCSIGSKEAFLMAHASVRMGYLSLGANMRAPAAAEPAKSFVVASSSGF